ncbi:uncharacterized protein N7498_004685 [Penicillium cinerascens]|uniref:Major facilitator superfamily (MFS) profile domain-containing protein n=1 Tax=Penicillium cinerascens TaxID=70096 RepID=A0A9W9MLY6_9EURO|nr:uncharacterized protein N7498_004685 [Penicillium cinerascens]KAJ5203806.1 hypothetical protein N7498_004685 [Penicillium cinerascens]
MSSAPSRAMEADPESQDREATVETPLLPRTSRFEDEESTTLHPQRHLTRVVAIILVSIFLLELGDFMMRAPSMRVLEDVICRKFYKSTTPFDSHIIRSIPEHECKIPSVQGKVAMMKGWNEAFSSVLGILLSQLWVQFVLYFNDIFDVQWIWAGNLFLLIGGGSAVSQNFIYAIVADVAPESKRGPIFFQVSAAALISTVIGIPLSWLLMKADSFDALLAASGFIALGTILILLLPETLQDAKESDAALHDPVQNLHTEEDISPVRAKSSIIDMKTLIVKFVDDSRFILANPSLCALIFTFILSSLSSNSVSILFQLASERFQWSLADASFLLPFGSLTNFVILVGILPFIYSVLGSRFHFRSSTKDLLVARGSLVFHILGAIVIAFSTGPLFLIFVLGLPLWIIAPPS